MSDERKEYVVNIGGIDHTMLLDADEAKARDAKPVEAKQRTAQNKARAADTK